MHVHVHLPVAAHVHLRVAALGCLSACLATRTNADDPEKEEESQPFSKCLYRSSCMQTDAYTSRYMCVCVLTHLHFCWSSYF